MQRQEVVGLCAVFRRRFNAVRDGTKMKDHAGRARNTTGWRISNLGASRSSCGGPGIPVWYGPKHLCSGLNQNELREMDQQWGEFAVFAMARLCDLFWSKLKAYYEGMPVTEAASKEGCYWC
jgi:hypothetical protein